jgi:hypothetical protein
VRGFCEVESEHLRACEFPPCDFTSHNVCVGVDGFFLVVLLYMYKRVVQDFRK